MSVIAEIIDTLKIRLKTDYQNKKIRQNNQRFTNRINKICRHHTNSIK
jgi:hypothetical protein